MKKIALTSLLAVFAAAGANAANVIDGNPLYMPRAGHFYSETALDSRSDAGENWTLAEEFGYGITDLLAVDIKTSLSETGSFDTYSWDDLTLKLTARVLQQGAWRADVYGGYGIVEGVWPYHAPFLAEEGTSYGWTVGVRGGYMTSEWTVAGHFDFTYTGSESFNWGDAGVRVFRAGVDGQYLIDSDWNLVAGVEYTGLDGNLPENMGSWTGTFGVNYNIDATKYVGAWISGGMNHHQGDAGDSWGFVDGVGYGIKFGIDF